MNRSGIVFILAAFFLLTAFVLDTVFFRPNRQRVRIENFDDVDTSPPDARDIDPTLYDPTIIDVTDERFMLNAEELEAAEDREDYLYEVQDGDTIDELARKFLGRHDAKSHLFRENPQLRPGGRLEPGTTITIPFRYRR